MVFCYIFCLNKQIIIKKDKQMTTSKKTFFVMLLMLLTISLSQKTFATETRFVSSINAKLLNKPAFKAKLVKQLTKGTRLTIASKQGTWLKVTTINKDTGWISKFLTKPTPPSKRATILTGEKNNQLKDVHRRTSAITTAAAARGLASKASASTTNVKTNLQAVTYMESFKLSNTELSNFAKPIFAKTVRGEK